MIRHQAPPCPFLPMTTHHEAPACTPAGNGATRRRTVVGGPCRTSGAGAGGSSSDGAGATGSGSGRTASRRTRGSSPMDLVTSTWASASTADVPQTFDHQSKIQHPGAQQVRKHASPADRAVEESILPVLRARDREAAFPVSPDRAGPRFEPRPRRIGNRLWIRVPEASPKGRAAAAATREVELELAVPERLASHVGDDAREPRLDDLGP